MKCEWIIDTLITERADPTGLPTLAEAARSLGHIVHETRYRPLAGDFSAFDPPLMGVDDERPVIFHGTHEALRATRRYQRIHQLPVWSPCGYCRYEHLSYAGYASHLGDKLLNSDFVLLPVGELRRRCAKDAAAFLAPFGGAAFIRPNVVTKTFSARVIAPHNVELELKTLSAAENIPDDTIAVIASPKDMSFEFRFVIANRRVVAQSQYQYNGRLDIRTDVMPQARALADQVAAMEWQADTVYVCDVGLLKEDQSPKVVELNSFSCAGLYACDTVAIVDAVSKAAAAEFGGDPDEIG